MIDDKMAQAAEELLAKMGDISGSFLRGGSSNILIAAERLVSNYKGNVKDQMLLTLDRSELKEYSMIFDEVGLKFKVTQVPNEDKLLLMFSNKDITKYEQAVDLVNKARGMINEVELTKFMKSNMDTDLEKRGPLDEVELSRFRTYANRGSLEYAVSYVGSNDFSTLDEQGNKLEGVEGYRVVFKSKDKEEVNKLITRTIGDFVGIKGAIEREKAFMQLKTYNAAEVEINKQNTEFVVVDAMFPENNMVVLEDKWTLYQGDKMIKESDSEKSKLQHKQEVLDTVHTLSAPLVMSIDEYKDIEKRTKLIKDSKYFAEIQGPEELNLKEKVLEKVNKLKVEPVSQQEKVNVVPLKDKVKEKSKSKSRTKQKEREQTGQAR